MLKKILFVVAFLLFTGWQVHEFWPTEVKISGTCLEEDFVIKMPFKDKKRLDYFFRNACLKGVWAYTLMNVKPVSFTYYIKPSALVRQFFQTPLFKNLFHDLIQAPSEFVSTFRLYFFRFHNRKMKMGWKTLLKYQSYFTQSRFIFFEEKGNAEWEDTVMPTLVNKPLFKEIVEDHIQDFHLILQNDQITSEDLLSEMVEGKRPFTKDVLKENHALLGILLGFGRQNSWLYHDREQGNAEIFDILKPAWVEFEDENLEQIIQKTYNFEPWNFTVLFYPRFVADPSSQETKELRKTYMNLSE